MVEPHIRRHIVNADRSRGRAHDENFEQPAELLAIAAPWERSEDAFRRVAELLRRHVPGGAQRVHQVHGQLGDVVTAIAKRRHVDAHTAQPLVESGKYAPVLHGRIE